MSDFNRRKMRQPKGRSSYNRSQHQNELDRYLESKNLWRKHIAKDGSCLFRAVAEQVYLSQVDHLHVRRECVEHIRQHQAKYKEFLEEPVDSYLFKLCHPTSWAGEIELAALAEIYHRRIEVYHYHSNQVGLKSFGCSRPGQPSILLAYSDGNHYDSIMTKEFRNNSAICQSVLYELLFKSVLQLPVPDRKDLQMYSRQQREYLGDSSLRNFHSDDLMAFSSKVYFNAALGVHKTYKEDLESQDWQIAMAMQFQEGDECQVWIDHRKEKKLFDGVIKATNTSKGKHQVFIYDLKKTMEVKHQDFNVLSLVGGRKPSHIKNSDWLTQQNKRKANDKPSSGRREKGSGSQGKSSSEKGRTKTYLMASHRKKREQVVPNNLESDEVDPEIQEQLRLIELQDKDSSFPALSSQVAKAVNEPYDLVSSVTHQPVASSATAVTSSAVPVLTTTIAGSLPSSVMPKVKPIQKQQKVSTTTGIVVSTHPPVVPSHSPAGSAQPQVTSTRQQPKGSYLNTSTHFVSTNNSPLNSTKEFFLAKNVATAAPMTNMMAPKSTVAVKENHLALHNGNSIQQHTDVAKQLMQVIHQEKENQQSSERQLMTLSMTLSPNSSAELHSSWPELLSQDEQRATPLHVQEQQNVAPPTLSSASAPVSKSPYATQALPTANTITHMPSTAVKVAKAPPSFFTITRAPPTTGQATPTTKIAQAAMIRTSVAVTSSGVPAAVTNKISMATGNQATPTNKVFSVPASANQATPFTKASAVGSLATPTTNRALSAQYQNFSVPTSAIKTSGFVGTTLAPSTSITAGSSPTVTRSPRVKSPRGLNLEMPLVQLPKPPLQLFQDGENGHFFEQYGRMCFAILLDQCPDLAQVIHGKTHSHDIDYSEEERRLIEEQSQRLETWKKSPIGILHTMKELQSPGQSEECLVNITKPAGLPVAEPVSSQPLQDGTRKLQIVFPSLKEPSLQEEDSAVKDFGIQGKEKGCFKNLNKEELELLHSLMKKLDFHQLQNEAAATATGGVSSDETISAHTTSSLPPSDTEGTLSTASEPTAQMTSPVQTVPEPHPSESQSAESSTTSPDVEPPLQHTKEGVTHEDMIVNTDANDTAENPEENNMEQHNLDEGAAFTPGMIHPHNPMAAAMATMGPFLPPAAAAGFMPTMLPAPITPYMMPPHQAVYYYHQMLQHAHYSQMLQQSMAAAAVGSPTLLSNNQEDGNFFFQQKNMDLINSAGLQDIHSQAVDPVEVTANTNHADNEQLRGNSPLQPPVDLSQGGLPASTVPSMSPHLNHTPQGINMAPASFTGTTPIMMNSLPLSGEENTSSSNTQLQFATDDHQFTNPSKDLLKSLLPKVPIAPAKTEPVGTNNNSKMNHVPRREPPKNHTNQPTGGNMATNARTNNSHTCKQLQSNKQDNNNNKRSSNNVQQRTPHHTKYDVDSIDHELSQMGMHNSFPNGIPSMVFSSENKRRKVQQT